MRKEEREETIYTDLIIPVQSGPDSKPLTLPASSASYEKMKMKKKKKTGPADNMHASRSGANKIVRYMIDQGRGVEWNVTVFLMP